MTFSQKKKKKRDCKEILLLHLLNMLGTTIVNIHTNLKVVFLLISSSYISSSRQIDFRLKQLNLSSYLDFIVVAINSKRYWLLWVKS